MRWGYIDTSQSVNCDCAVMIRKQWRTSSVAGYLMRLAPRKNLPSSQRGKRHVPGCGNTLCEGHERREVQQWIGNHVGPTDWVWQYRDESLVQLTTDRPIAPTRVLRIVSSGYKTGCWKTCGRQGCIVHPCAVTAMDTYAATFVRYPSVKIQTMTHRGVNVTTVVT